MFQYDVVAVCVYMAIAIYGVVRVCRSGLCNPRMRGMDMVLGGIGLVAALWLVYRHPLGCLLWFIAANAVTISWSLYKAKRS